MPDAMKTIDLVMSSLEEPAGGIVESGFPSEFAHRRFTMYTYTTMNIAFHSTCLIQLSRMVMPRLAQGR